MLPPLVENSSRDRAFFRHVLSKLGKGLSPSINFREFDACRRPSDKKTIESQRNRLWQPRLSI